MPRQKVDTSGLSPAGLAELRRNLANRLNTDDGTYAKVADELKISKGALWKFLNTNYIPTDDRIRHALGLPEVIISFRHRNEKGQFT